MKKLVLVGKLGKIKDEIGEILHLPLVQRLIHVKSRRVVVSALSGLGIMVTGVILASNGEVIEHKIGVPVLFSDLVGYFIHGVGAVPFMRYVDPLWNLLMGEAEEIAESVI